MLIVAVFEIGNTKQWKTKRVLCVIYQEISAGIVTYPVVFSIFFLSEGKKNGKTLGYYFDLILICHSVLETNQTIRGSMKLLIMCFHHLFYSTYISSVLQFYLNLLIVLLLFSSHWISDLKTNEAVGVVDLDT